MSPELAAERSGKGLRFAIVYARFNEMVTSRLLTGAKQAFAENGVAEKDVDITSTPGAFEIPLAARRLAETRRYAGIVCLGAVIRGETDHYHHVSSSAINGMSRVGLDTGVPIALGVLTTENLEQALARAGTGRDNKGFEAALAALEMANLLRRSATEFSA